MTRIIPFLLLLATTAMGQLLPVPAPTAHAIKIWCPWSTNLTCRAPHAGYWYFQPKPQPQPPTVLRLAVEPAFLLLTNPLGNNNFRLHPTTTPGLVGVEDSSDLVNWTNPFCFFQSTGSNLTLTRIQ